MGRRPKKETLLEDLDQIPPVICRMLARRFAPKWGHSSPLEPLTMTEIAKKADLPLGVARWIAMQPSWENVKVGHASKFRQACGVTHRNVKLVLRFIRSQLKKDVPWDYLDKLRSIDKRNIEKHLNELMNQKQ